MDTNITMAPPQYTAQEVFDKVVKHLLTQKERAEANGLCKYRLIKDDGKVLKCAVGCLIPDELYDLDFEGEAFMSLYDGSTDPIQLMAKLGYDKHITLLQDLQSLHDCLLPHRWYNALVSYAQNHNLTFNPPTT